MKTPILLTTILTASILMAAFSPSLFTQAQTNITPWQVTVTGLVGQPTNFTIANLQAMPQTSIDAPIICVGPPPTQVDGGNWTGVTLLTLLNQAGGIQPGAVKIAFYASDGYTTDQPIDAVQRGDIILAYAKNGLPLSEMLRLVVPGEFGYKWISQVTKIEVVNYDFLGKYENSGYSDDGTSSPLTIPGSITQTPPPSTGPTTTPTTTPTQTPTTPPLAKSPDSSAPQATSSLPVQSEVNPRAINIVEVAFALIAIAAAAAVILAAVRIRKNR